MHIQEFISNSTPFEKPPLFTYPPGKLDGILSPSFWFNKEMNVMWHYGINNTDGKLYFYEIDSNEKNMNPPYRCYRVEYILDIGDNTICTIISYDGFNLTHLLKRVSPTCIFIQENYRNTIKFHVFDISEPSIQPFQRQGHPQFDMLAVLFKDSS